MELEFVRRVSMGEEKASRVKALAQKLDVSLSVHAPYYINLNAADREILEASKKRLVLAARIGALCGAAGIAFHAGSYMGETPARALRTIKKHLRDVRRILLSEGNKILLWPESAGRHTQFGTTTELIELCGETEGTAPCIDFAHLHAAAGGALKYDGFATALEQVRSGLGAGALSNLHMHVSGIRYGKKGELEHINLDESDFDYQSLLLALRDFSVGGRLICESRDREADALLLKQMYESLERKGAAG